MITCGHTDRQPDTECLQQQIASEDIKKETTNEAYKYNLKYTPPCKAR